MIPRIIIFIFIYLFFIIKHIKTDSNCIINGLEANSCDFSNPLVNIYTFTTLDLIIIKGVFEIPKFTRLNFNGPVEFSYFSTIKFNCESQIGFEFECIQVYSETSVIYHADKYLVNLNISNLNKEYDGYYQFTDYNYLSTYNYDNSITVNPPQLFQVNITNPIGYNTAYYSIDKKLYFQITTEEVSKSIDLNITCNCQTLLINNIIGDLNSLGFSNDYIYSYNNITNGISNYFYIKVYPSVNGKDPLLVLDKFTDSYMKSVCKVLGGNTMNYKINVIDSYGDDDVIPKPGVTMTTIPSIATPISSSTTVPILNSLLLLSITISILNNYFI